MKSKSMLTEIERKYYKSLFALDNPAISIDEFEKCFDALLAAEQEIGCLLSEIERLKEYEFMYKGLEK